MIASFVLRPGFPFVRYFANATPQLLRTVNANSARCFLSLRVLKHVLFELLAAEHLSAIFALVVGVLACHEASLPTLGAY